MRTTLTLDEDVGNKARDLAKKLDRPFKAVVNDALRRGLDELERPVKPRRYRTRPRPMGLRSGFGLDNIQELLAQVEGEESR